MGTDGGEVCDVDQDAGRVELQEGDRRLYEQMVLAIRHCPSVPILDFWMAENGLQMGCFGPTDAYLAVARWWKRRDLLAVGQ